VCATPVSGQHDTYAVHPHGKGSVYDMAPRYRTGVIAVRRRRVTGVNSAGAVPIVTARLHCREAAVAWVA